jgi:uncharacterized protein with beta-barrel porin domain
MDGGFAYFGVAPENDEVLTVDVCPRQTIRATRRAMLKPISAALARRAWAFAVLLLLFGAHSGHAQGRRGPPPPTPTVPTTSVAIGSASDYALFGLGSRYLQFLADKGGTSSYRSLFGTGANPGGGGAPAPTDETRWSAWTQLYGIATQTGAQSTYPGDTRRTYGGNAGISFNATPEATLGLSVDQSRSGIDIVGIPQHANLDLTQVAVNGAYQWGSWTFSAAGVAGFGNVDSNRDTPSGPATASYGANLWGLIGEADYLIPFGSARVVPKFGADWTQTRADAYTEAGGVDAVSVPSATVERGRIFAGLEIGNTWVTNATVFDLSGYAKAMDILVQHVPALTVSAAGGGATPVTVLGVTESKYGVDAGATASVRLSATTRLYATYDGKFRDGFTSHGGTLGMEFRW